jgi:hypothetical protein
LRDAQEARIVMVRTGWTSQLERVLRLELAAD